MEDTNLNPDNSHLGRATSGIANMDMIAPTSSDGGEGFTGGVNDREVSMTDTAELDSAAARLAALIADLDAAISSMPHDSEERREAENAKSSAGAGLAQVKAALNNPNVGNITAALSNASKVIAVASAVMTTADSAGTTKAMQSMPLMSDMDITREVIQRDTQIARRMNIAGFANYSTEAQEFLTQGVYQKLGANVPQVKTAMLALNTIQESPVLSGIQQESLEENKRANEEMRRDPVLSRNKEIQEQLDRNDALKGRNARLEDHALDNPLKAYRDAVASGMSEAEAQRALAASLKTIVDHRHQEMEKIVENTLQSFETAELGNQFLSDVGQGAGLAPGVKPTALQVQSHIRNITVDNKQLNDAIYVVNKRIEEHGGNREAGLKAAWDQLSPAQRTALSSAHAKAASEFQQVDYNIREMMENLSPEQRQQMAAELKEKLEAGKIDEVMSIVQRDPNNKAFDSQEMETFRRLAQHDPSRVKHMLSESIDKLEKGTESSYRDFNSRLFNARYSTEEPQQPNQPSKPRAEEFFGFDAASRFMDDKAQIDKIAYTDFSTLDLSQFLDIHNPSSDIKFGTTTLANPLPLAGTPVATPAKTESVATATNFSNILLDPSIRLGFANISGGQDASLSSVSAAVVPSAMEQRHAAHAR
ncbi:MAG: hypothetical protein EAZ74_03365 [Alphaproteobacteria bacterium]|nr:MAG: hypothetical protein EAY76_03345 [Alphaproteobacteria bacterium]TAF14720.1 MAG: hypothetical protein EAZ74_03365 [Alphaproteobacteria bacterium]TAF38888.1 MAG: hypothetical protein EAZ66_05745 [Alphaproteobacteria bacterium]TAF75191.1 MAG: hypothetical protein EAZ52_07230 [Alphaproteobacteria bacterium]